MKRRGQGRVWQGTKQSLTGISQFETQFVTVHDLSYSACGHIPISHEHTSALLKNDTGHEEHRGQKEETAVRGPPGSGAEEERLLLLALGAFAFSIAPFI
jgi:hypothetical protein